MIRKLTASIQDQSQVDTLIPLLALRLGTVQKAITSASEIVRESIKRFEAAEKELLERYSDSKVQEDIRKFIDGSKYACTANLNWRYVPPLSPPEANLPRRIYPSAGKLEGG